MNTHGYVGNITRLVQGVLMCTCALGALASQVRAQSTTLVDSSARAKPIPTPGIAGAMSPTVSALLRAIRHAQQTIPTELLGYSATVESEVAVVLRTAVAREGPSSANGWQTGVERVLQVEQIESTLNWQNDGSIDQHVIGYRAHAITASLSTLSYFHRPWLVPVLYGNRLQLLFGHDSVVNSDSSSRQHSANDKALVAVHPFAPDGESYYHYTGGDTVTVLHLRNRAIPIVRILIEPVAHVSRRTLLFRGEIDIDADRLQVVRMIGQFVVQDKSRSALRRVLDATWQTIAYAELVNGEFDGRFWLPSEQRIEGQARTALAGEFSPILRVVSRFQHHELSTRTANTRATESKSTPSVQLTIASRDSLSAFGEWGSEIGQMTGETRAEDFDAVAPDRWRTQGAPRLDWRADRINDVVRFNRIEGAFTGIAATLRFRDAAPGAAVGAHVGWAWAEQTARGALWGRWRRSSWAYDARVERALANTNDFHPLLDYEQSLMAVLATADDYDYVDRRSAMVGVSHQLPVLGKPMLRLESGVARDLGEQRRVMFGLIHPDSSFRNNRPVAVGSYMRSAIGLELHPNVSGEFLEPGIGVGLWYVRGDGQLRWQRLEGRLTARHTVHSFTYAGRIDAIALFNRQVLPQQIIEFGENEGLPGYAFKEFGGDRAVLGRVAMSYELPFLHAPIRLGHSDSRFGRLVLPSLAPSLAIGFQGGWSEAHSASTRAALALFGTRVDTLSGQTMLATRPTGGVRSTVNVSLRFFGGALGVGVARPLDRLSPSSGWHFIVGIGQPF